MQNGTNHSRLQNSEKNISLHFPEKEATRVLNRGALDLQLNVLPLTYTPASANFCFVFRRNRYENALSRNIQNGTDHYRLRNSQENISLHFPEEEDTRG
ncbi:hypothetical protein TNCV_1981551 [Trichonephila clavipes]|nr:hypothetical protein TNCV_1981551 [Trichonephila clavipes]